VREEFIRQGHYPTYDAQEALHRAQVVIDCTPSANRNKSSYQSMEGPIGFIAAGGTDFGFGKLYVNEINDAALVPGEDRFIQVPSGNTHSLAYVIKLFGFDADLNQVESARFVCMRRCSDFSQERGFLSSPKVLPHDVEQFGTRQAREAHYVFKTLGIDLDLRSSVVLLSTQQMHVIWFSIKMKRALDTGQAVERTYSSRLAARTDKQTASLVLAFARDHGWKGRIFSRVVIPTMALSTRNSSIDGFCFEPQDSNELLSAAAATIWFLYPNQFRQRLEALSPFVFDEV
jgi:glyceraldehyde-3-phosphate dehydrogenase (NAD(P))